MKIKYSGEGTVSIDGAGQVSGGQTIEVNDELADKLTKQSPELWSKASEAKAKKRLERPQE